VSVDAVVIDPSSDLALVPPEDLDPPTGEAAPTGSLAVVPDPALDLDGLAVRQPLRRAAKRSIDLAVGLPAFLLLAPLLGLLAIAVKVSSRGPAFFRQERVGRDGECFVLWKLRTMRVDAEAMLESDPELGAAYRSHGFKLPIDQDPRITRLGRLLRRTSLDELPQLGNVIAGSMSLVGPRPVLAEELDALYGPRRAPYEAVKPGMTGLWQVSGRSHVTHAARAELDDQYVRSWSVRHDVALLLRTVPAVLRGVGAH
jgi:lipopolysaccharide/colanic/teichoic acid biosynthesis glycosyltransferase